MDNEIIGRVNSLEVEQRFIKDQLENIADSIGAFRTEMQVKENQRADARNADRFGRKDIVYLVLAVVTAVATLFGGSFYIIDGRVAPVRAQLASDTLQLNNRFDVFQESIKSLREIASTQARDISNTNINVSKLSDDIDSQERRWKSYEDLHLESHQATQAQKIDDISAHLMSVENQLQRDRDREMETRK